MLCELDFLKANISIQIKQKSKIQTNTSALHRIEKRKF